MCKSVDDNNVFVSNSVIPYSPCGPLNLHNSIIYYNTIDILEKSMFSCRQRSMNMAGLAT